MYLTKMPKNTILTRLVLQEKLKSRMLSAIDVKKVAYVLIPFLLCWRGLLAFVILDNDFACW